MERRSSEDVALQADRVSRFLQVFEDARSLRTWFDASFPKIHSFILARSGGVEEVAQDIAQETFVEVVRHRGDFDGRADPLTWVMGIARHKIMDHHRRTYRDQRRQLQLLDREQIEGSTVTPDPTGQIDARESILSALRELPEWQRVVLALHYLDGLSVKQMAVSLGRSESSVEALLFRGRSRFREAYLERSEAR